MSRTQSSDLRQEVNVGAEINRNRTREVEHLLVTTIETTTQSTEPDDTSNSSGSECEFDDDQTIRSYVPPRTPANSLINLDLEDRKVPIHASSAEVKDISSRDEKDRDFPSHLASIGEIGEGDYLSLELAIDNAGTSSDGAGRSANRWERTGSPQDYLMAGKSSTSSSNRYDSHTPIASSSRGSDQPSSYLSQTIAKNRMPRKAASPDDDYAGLDQVNELTSSGGIRPSNPSSGTAVEYLSAGVPSTLSPEYGDKDDKDHMDYISGESELPTHRTLDLEAEDDQRERDKRRLEQLGYSEVLGRDYGFWSSFSVGYCVIGGFQGAVLSTYVTYAVGGPQ
jgi:hypothetical protein